MSDTLDAPDASPEPARAGSVRRRRWIVIGAVVGALLVALAIGIAAATGSGSHPADTAKGSGAPGSTGSPGSVGGRPGAKTSQPSRASTAGSENKGSKGSGGGGNTATAPGGGGTTPGSSKSSATTPRGSTPTTRRGGSQTTIVVPPSIEQAYVQGFQDECRSLWAQAGPSGKLWDADSLEDPPHTIDECLSAVDPFNANAWSDYSPADARAGGRSDADTAAAGMTVGNRFQTASGLVVYIPDA